MLAPFRLYEPASLGEIPDLLLRLGPGTRLLAGGTDLLPNLERERLTARALVALPPLAALREVKAGPDGDLRLGALVTLAEIAHSPLIRAEWPILALTAAQMATPQVRRLATAGGNLCAGSPTADLAVALLALDARLEIQGRDGPYEIGLDEWLAAWGGPLLQPGDVLAGVRVPPQAGRAVYQRFTVRAAADVVLANVAVRLAADSSGVKDVRIVVGADGPRPGRAWRAEEILAGQGFDAGAAPAAAAAAQACLPDDQRASRTYRQALVRVLVARALAEAGARA